MDEVDEVDEGDGDDDSGIVSSAGADNIVFWVNSSSPDSSSSKGSEMVSIERQR